VVAGWSRTRQQQVELQVPKEEAQGLGVRRPAGLWRWAVVVIGERRQLGEVSCYQLECVVLVQ